MLECHASNLYNCECTQLSDKLRIKTGTLNVLIIEKHSMAKIWKHNKMFPFYYHIKQSCSTTYPCPSMSPSRYLCWGSVFSVPMSSTISMYKLISYTNKLTRCDYILMINIGTVMIWVIAWIMLLFVWWTHMQRSQYSWLVITNLRTTCQL